MRKTPIWIALLIALPALMACQQQATVTRTALPTNAPPSAPVTPSLGAPPATEVTPSVTPTEDLFGDDQSVEATQSGPSPTPLYNTDTLEGFRQLLLYALTTRNYPYLLYAMADPFTILDENGAGKPMASRDAIGKIQTDLMPRSSIEPLFPLQKDVKPLLGGKTPQEIFPDGTIVNAFYSTGWGKDGAGAAILFISQSQAQVFRWYGVMFASQGFK